MHGARPIQCSCFCLYTGNELDFEPELAADLLVPDPLVGLKNDLPLPFRLSEIFASQFAMSVVGLSVFEYEPKPPTLLTHVGFDASWN
jgi:hypothetical protein